MKAGFLQGIGITIASTIMFVGNSVVAQITPDATLPNNSQVRLQYNTRFIEGGTQAGGNLFHSFQEFSVPTNSEARFNNAADVQNILTRVTGGSISNIDGLISANGIANLFLINPNGIIFGQNASLNIGGSFVGSTANAIGFGKSGNFSATNPEVPTPLLTINPNALLFNQIQGGRIESRSIAPEGRNPSNDFDVNGLRVADGKSLLLVGGDVSINSGRLYAFGGRIELGGLADKGIVGLNMDDNNFNLSFPLFVQRSDVFLSNASVNASAGNGGSIAINARNLKMTGESQILAGIDRGLGSDNSKAGNIDINATGEIFLQQSSYIFNGVRANALGQGGNVNIRTGTLRLVDGSQIITSTRGAGQGGDLNINTGNGRVEVIGTSSIGFSSSITAQSNSTATGAAGNLMIKTGELIARDGGFISASTFGAGQSGNLTVNATSKVELIGKNTVRQFSSGLFVTQNTKGATGNVETLTINTPLLQVLDGAQLSVGTLGQGNVGNVNIQASKVFLNGVNSDISSTLGTISAPVINVITDKEGRVQVSIEPRQQNTSTNSAGESGNVRINTNLLSVTNGARLNTSTNVIGNAGNVDIRALDAKFSGISTDGKVSSGAFSAVEPEAQGNGGNINITTEKLTVDNGAQLVASTFGKGNAGNIIINAKDSVLVDGLTSNPSKSGVFSAVSDLGIGKGGNITVTTRILSLVNNAEASVSNSGKGDAGNLTVNADSINLNSEGKLRATSDTGRGGDIRLDIKDLLLLNGNSLISAISGVPGNNGLDGNINIRAGFIVANPNENSDIITTGFGRTPGSNIQVNAQKIFGTQYRQFQTPKSDIVATGQVTLNVLDIDPSRKLAELPEYIVNAAALINQHFCARAYKSSFTITGRGGIVPSPFDLLESNATWEDWRVNPIAQGSQEGERVIQERSEKKVATTAPKEIVEAQGWVVNKKGQVELVASTQNVTPHRLQSIPVECLLNTAN